MFKNLQFSLIPALDHRGTDIKWTRAKTANDVDYGNMTFIVQLLLLKKKGKLGLLYLADSYPYVFKVSDWTAIIKIILDQKDLESLAILTSPGFSSIFNSLSIKDGSILLKDII